MKQHIDNTNDIDYKNLIQRLVPAAFLGLTIMGSNIAIAGEYNVDSDLLNGKGISENQIQIHTATIPSKTFLTVALNKSPRDKDSSDDDPYSARIIDC